MLRNKLFSSLNLIGLTLGISSSLLILLWVLDEYSVDSFHNKNVYQILENQRFTDGYINTARSTPGPLVPAIKYKYPEIERATRVLSLGDQLIQVEDKSFIEPMQTVDSDFLEMFNFPLKQGNPKAILTRPDGIVITESLGRKLFGNMDPIGKMVHLNQTEDYFITGVLKDIPGNSTLKFSCLLPIEPFYKKNEGWFGKWGNHSARSYVLLRNEAEVSSLEKKILNEHRAWIPTSAIDFIIQPFHETYLHSVYQDGRLTERGRIENVRTFSIVGAFILLIACINFMNLATAQSVRRSKEVGIRKVVGALRLQLVKQFLGESILFTLVASLFAFVIVGLSLPIFNFVTDKHIAISIVQFNAFLLVGGLVLTTGLLAGSYPAIYLSEFKPTAVLKGLLKTGRSAHLFRGTLVTVQFALSIATIICVLVIREQMDFIQNRDSGLNREGLVYVPSRSGVMNNAAFVKQELLKLPFIHSASFSSVAPLKIDNYTFGLEWEGKSNEQEIKFNNLFVDEDFLRTTGATLLGGRQFNDGLASDSTNIIINETAMRAMGLELDKAIGSPVTWYGGYKGDIIGVVKDFNFESMHNGIQPLLLFPFSKRFQGNFPINALTVRIENYENEKAVSSIKNIFSRFSPEYPFEYHFVADDWAELHKSEVRVNRLFLYFAILSIVISCLGLFGLSAFAAEQRRKEIGIRKVMGADVRQLIFLLTTYFAKFVLVAVIPGCCLSWYYMTDWLHGFAYHIEVGYFTILAAFGSVFMIAVITVSYQAIKVAMDNPINSLKQE